MLEFDVEVGNDSESPVNTFQEIYRQVEGLPLVMAGLVGGPAWAAAARAFRKRIKAVAPVSSTRRTGIHLRDRVRVFKRKWNHYGVRISGSASIIGVWAPHAHLLEYGTVKMSPRPFFRGSVESSEGEAFDAAQKAAVSAFDKLSRQLQEGRPPRQLIKLADQSEEVT